MSIYIASHKKISYSLGDPYVNFLLGEKKSESNHLTETDGENIAHKNSRYCELTGYYWLWKNCSDSFIGLVHYRRHFQSKFRKYDISLKSVISSTEVESLLKDFDIIVPKRRILPRSIKEEYALKHYREDWELAKEVLLKHCPMCEFSLCEVENRYYSYDFNMLITSNVIFFSYCEWLFPILFEVESKLDFDKYDAYQYRAIGFLAERLFNVWLHFRSDLKVKEVKVTHTELSIMESVKGLVKDELRRIIGSYD